MLKCSRFAVMGCLAIMGLLFTYTIASADIAVAPLTKTIQVTRGRSASVVYTVANRSSEPVTVEFNARTWFSLPENADISVDKWLKLGIEKITLGPNKEKKLKFKVSVPKSANGELAAMIYFTPERKKEQMLGTSYGVSLYVFVKGTEIVKPEIGSISISREEDKSYLVVTIENRGNVHFRPRVNAVVTTEEGFREDIELPFGKPIFGGQAHNFFKELKSGLPEEGICSVDVSCNYGDSEDTIIKKSVTLDLKKP